MNIPRMVSIFILVIAVIGGSFFYIGRRIFQALAYIFPGINVAIYICIYIVIATSFMLGRLSLPPIIKSLMSSIGSIWLGLFIYLLILFLISDIMILVGSLIKLIPADMQTNLRFYAGATVILLSIGIVCFGIYNSNQTKFVSYSVQLNKSLSNEMKIAFISDLHLGDANSEKRLEGIVQGINSLNPDIVCIVGDIFSDGYYNVKDPDKASTLFGSIDAIYGVYACLGNHDGGSTLTEMVDFLQRSNVILLNDESVTIDQRLVLVGRLDSSPIGRYGELSRKDFSEIMVQTDASLPVVVMDHNPGNIGQYDSNVDLILSGHTHRGQVFPGNLLTRMIYTVDYGYYKKDADSPQVIVTQGVGTWMLPMRIGTNNEIVSLVLS